MMRRSVTSLAAMLACLLWLVGTEARHVPLNNHLQQHKLEKRGADGEWDCSVIRQGCQYCLRKQPTSFDGLILYEADRPTSVALPRDSCCSGAVCAPVFAEWSEGDVKGDVTVAYQCVQRTPSTGPSTISEKPLCVKRY